MPTFKQYEQALASWRNSRCSKIELPALISRNPIAHKWKATYRSIVLRELVHWRLEDLLSQMLVLWKQEHILGALILLRSAIETLAVLIYLNQKTEAILKGDGDFFEYATITSRLMLGSKNKSTNTESINILSVLERSNKKYPGLVEIYAELSESAHPNYRGVCNGYSRIDEVNYTTKFVNRWNTSYDDKLSSGFKLCMSIFEFEYNDVWPKHFEQLETWLSDNDARLESEKPTN